jgi:hypothetical protein
MFLFSHLGWRVFLALIASVVLLGQISHACDLNGKSILVEVVTCPDTPDDITPRCVQGRQRYAVVGANVLEYSQESVPSGLVFRIGETIVVGPGHELYRYLFNDHAPEMTGQAKITASFSVGQLRLFRETLSDGPVQGRHFTQRNSLSIVLDINDSCDACKVISHAYTLATYLDGDLSDERAMTLSKQSCEIRNGV